MQHGYQCGMIWGAVLAAGGQAYRLFGPGAKAEVAAVLAARKLIDSFDAQNDHINCLEITEIDKTSTALEMIVYFLIKGGTVGCAKRAAKYAPVALEQINTVFSQELAEIPETPVSCTALLAQKMGVSEKQVTMAAGLAGGIGLCGGACGALGAAIWMKTLKNSKDGKVKVSYKNPRTQELIDSFLEQTSYEFECSKIVGREFQDVQDHAAYIHNGGCSEIIELLAKT